MNIGIDARGLDKNKAGISTYIEEIIKKINNSEEKENRYILYSNKKINLNVNLKDNIIIKECNTKLLGSFWLYFKLPKMLKTDNIDVFWGTQHCLPRRNKHTKNIRFVLTICDLAIKKLKTVGSFKNTVVQKLFLKKSIKHADKIIAISKATKNDILEIYKIVEDKISVVYCGTNVREVKTQTDKEKEEILKKFKIKDTPYIFFLSTIEPRKNVETLIKAFNYIRRKEDIKLKLILAGGLGWKYQGVLDLVENSEFKNDIIMPGYISKEEKNLLYENAECFVYPSLYEGFGLPILEAMSNKVLVVTGNNSSLPEVGGEAAFYYESALNYSELGNKILEAINLSEEEKENKINQGLERVKKFTWEKCIKETIEILNNKN